MSNELTPAHGVMEGKGAYNKYAKLPTGGGWPMLSVCEGVGLLTLLLSRSPRCSFN